MAEPPRPDRNGGGPARSAVLLVVTGERRLLLQLRDDAPSVVHPGRWGAFGGGVEPGELPEDAVRREMREETGLEVTGARLLTEVVDVEGAGRLVSVFYVVGGVDPRQIVLTEGTAIGEHDLSDLPDLPMVPFVCRVVESDLALRLGWT